MPGPAGNLGKRVITAIFKVHVLVVALAPSLYNLNLHEIHLYHKNYWVIEL